MSISSLDYEGYMVNGVIMVWSVMAAWERPRGGVWMHMMGDEIDLCILDALRQHLEWITLVIFVDYRFMVNMDIYMIVISS